MEVGFHTFPGGKQYAYVKKGMGKGAAAPAPIFCLCIAPSSLTLLELVAPSSSPRLPSWSAPLLYVITIKLYGRLGAHERAHAMEKLEKGGAAMATHKSEPSEFFPRKHIAHNLIL